METYRKRLLNLALPILAENVLQALMTLVDTYLVAQLGLTVVSGIALAGNVLAVYQALFIAIGAVSSAAVAKTYAADQRSEWLQISQSSVTLTVAISLGMGLLSLGFGTRFLALLGAGPEVSQQGGLYLALVGGSCLTLGLMTTFGAMLRAQGQTKWPMLVSFIVNGVNIGLSAIAVFFLGWGVLGVGLGTVLARLVGIVLLGLKLPQRKHLRAVRLDEQLIKQAVPAAGERLMMRAGDIIVVSLVVLLGTKVVAGHAIGEALTQFNYLPVLSVASATVILTAQTYGNGKCQELEALQKESFWLGFLGMATLSGLLLLISPILIRLYTADPVASQAAHQVVWMSFLGTPVTTGTLIMTSFWQGIGRAKLPFYATTIGMWAVRIGLGLVLVRVLGFRLTGVLVATLADNAFRFIFLTYLYQKYMRRFILD